MSLVLPEMPRNEVRSKLKKLVCEEFECSESELTGQGKMRHLIDARSTYCLISREYLKETLIRIGIEIRRDHSTVIHLIRRAEDFIYVKDSLAERIEKVKQQLLTNLI